MVSGKRYVLFKRTGVADSPEYVFCERRFSMLPSRPHRRQPWLSQQGLIFGPNTTFSTQFSDRFCLTVHHGGLSLTSCSSRRAQLWHVIESCSLQLDNPSNICQPNAKLDRFAGMRLKRCVPKGLPYLWHLAAVLHVAGSWPVQASSEQARMQGPCARGIANGSS